jgi:hypothetical protein
MPVTPSNTTSHAIIADSTFPPMKTIGAPRPPRPIKSNNDLALDFIELSFRLESGRDLPVFTRFEEPITVRVTGSTPQSLGSDLTKIATPSGLSKNDFWEDSCVHDVMSHKKNL